MKYKIKWEQYIYSIFLLISGCFYGQNNISLTSVLKSIEQQHQVTFNYNPAQVENIVITPPQEKFTLTQKLNYLSTHTIFIYDILKNGIITIKKRPKTTFCGILIDQISKKPIPFCTIKTEDEYFVSDKNGMFLIPEIQKGLILKINHLSYKTIQYSINTQNLSENCVNIELQTNTELLNEVVLPSYLVRGIDKLENGALQVNFKDFSLLPGLIEADVLKSTQSLPGIQSLDETVSNINIRGGANDQNLVIWDDIKMYQSGHFFGLISIFNPQITRKATVIKNGTSSKYTDGISGTIRMQTDQEITDHTTGNIGFNLLSTDAFLDINLGKKSSLQVAGRRSLNDILNTPTYDSYFDRISQGSEIENNSISTINSDKQFNFYDLSFRWLYNFSSKDKLRINFINIENDLTFRENTSIEDQVLTRNSSLSQNSIAGGINYSHDWNTQHQTTFQAHETDYSLRSENVNILENQRFLQKNNVSETSAKILHQYKLSDTWKFSGGYHFVETGITNLDDVDNPIFRRRITEVIRTHGIFTQFNLNSLSKKTALQLGLRYNFIEKFKKNIIEPRLSLRHELTPKLTLDLQGEFKHQNTSQVVNFQNDFLGIERFRWQLANNNTIPVIESKQVSLGLNYSKKGWLIDLTSYYKTVDGITSQSQGFETKFEFERAIGSYNVFGVDFLLRKRIQNYTTWLSYGFMENSYLFNSLEDVKFPSNFNIPHSITIGSTYEKSKLKISGGLNWRIGKPTTSPIIKNPIVDGTINFDIANSQNLTNYFSVNLSSIYQILQHKKMKIELGASLLNITNRKNIISNFFRINSNETVQEFQQESLGITANGLIRVSFF